MAAREGLILETLLTVEQVAERLQVHVVTVRRWIKAGQLRALGGPRKIGYRIRQQDLDAFMVEANREAATA